jgi:hypothetical protein
MLEEIMGESQTLADTQRPHPSLRENIWHIDLDTETAMLITSEASYEVPRDDALRFLRMRSHCTGWNSPQEIARKSGLAVEEVDSILGALREVGVVDNGERARAELAPDDVARTLIKICRIWSDELRLGYVGNEVIAGHLPKNALLGWLVEMYHYIKDFPFAIEHATRFAQGPLRDVLTTYANQEKGHEVFVLRTLRNLGVKPEEVETATPLLSTRTVAFLMRELFELEPAATLLMAALVEAQEFDEAQGRAFRQRLLELYDIPLESFQPFFEHQQIDVNMGHAELLEKNVALVQIGDRGRLDQVINKLHDLKHAFELQTLEIKSYYGTLDGKYFPRQAMRYAAL